MNKKSIAYLLMIVAAALGGPAAVREVVTTDVVPVIIDGPGTAEVGELVHVSITGEKPSWLLPTTDAHVVGSDCYISFRKPGTYEIVASASSSIVKLVIVVGAQPAPEPAPAPQSSLASDVKAWAAEFSAPRDVCQVLGNNFISAAEGSTSIESLLTSISTLNRGSDQTGAEALLARIQRYIFENVQGRDFGAHRLAFSEIGEGLLLHANNQ